MQRLDHSLRIRWLQENERANVVRIRRGYLTITGNSARFYEYNTFLDRLLFTRWVLGIAVIGAHVHVHVVGRYDGQRSTLEAGATSQLSLTKLA
jgi:hypothetical protein